MCCLQAVEKAIGVEPSEQTMLLRNLAMHGAMIRDHAMHLYFFVLPDLFGKDSVLDFEGDEKELLHQALHVKEAGNKLSKAVAGRAVHPPFPTVGGFTQLPEAGAVKEVLKELKAVREPVLELVQLFQDCDWKHEHPNNFVALVNNDYSYLEGKEIASTNGTRIPEKEFFEHLHRVVLPYSQATGFEFQGSEYMVGAIARMNLNKKSLCRQTKRDVEGALAKFPSENVFHNNLAQAIETLQSVDEGIGLLESSEFKKEIPARIELREGIGLGVIEAPRGTLYYEIEIDGGGKVKKGNLVIPTAQNLVGMEQNIKRVVQENLHLEKEEIEREVEKLIRAYDPCMSCATHFLKVRWDVKR
jgi:coenzyme F420-reducing hydrogenase alpha subunit